MCAAIDVAGGGAPWPLRANRRAAQGRRGSSRTSSTDARPVRCRPSRERSGRGGGPRGFASRRSRRLSMSAALRWPRPVPSLEDLGLEPATGRGGRRPGCEAPAVTEGGATRPLLERRRVARYRRARSRAPTAVARPVGPDPVPERDGATEGPRGFESRRSRHSHCPSWRAVARPCAIYAPTRHRGSLHHLRALSCKDVQRRGRRTAHGGAHSLLAPLSPDVLARRRGGRARRWPRGRPAGTHGPYLCEERSPH